MRLLQTSIIRFLISGLLATITDFLLYSALIIFGGIHPLLANGVAFSIALIETLILHTFWTFTCESQHWRKEQKKYVTVAAIGFIVSSIIIFLLFVTTQNAITAKIAATIVTVIISFFLYRNWSFKSRRIPCTHQKPTLDLSIVIPAYNEEKRLPSTLTAYTKFLHQQKNSYEIIVVDDGSTDQTAAVAQKNSTIKLICLPNNQGKGAAVRTGVLAAAGRYILITDADHATPITEFLKLKSLLEKNNHDIVIGSRYDSHTSIQTKQPLIRRAVSRLGNSIIRTLLLPGLKDTQCGFKLFCHQPAMAIFSRLKMNRFGFDVEALVVARQLGFSIGISPVLWSHKDDSRVQTLRHSIDTFGEILLIKLNQLTGRYQ